MMKNKWISLLSVGCLVFGMSHAVAQQQVNPDTLPVEDLQRFAQALEMVKRYYVNPVSDQVVLENAIRGMLTGLDPHSAYLDEKDFSDLQVSTSGQFGGLGIEVTMENGIVKVVSPIDDTPAQKAGILPGDYIIQIDEVPVKGLSLHDAVDKMRGDVGEKISLVVLRKSEAKPLKIDIVRQIISVKSVKSKLYDNEYGYIRISRFQENTGKDLVTAYKKLQKGAKSNQLSGLVIDLRNNPGGLLNAAVDVSDAFLDHSKLTNKKIVYTKGRLDDSMMIENAKTDDVSHGIPLVILVNGGSASASEIVAGALQDHKRAVVMGEKTFGKGSVQTIFPLRNTALKMTTALYYTPAGRSIQAQGIEPDIIVLPLVVKKTEAEQSVGKVTEAKLHGRLANGNKGQKTSQAQGGNVQAQFLASEDYQLYEAINLLKGMRAVGQSS